MESFDPNRAAADGLLVIVDSTGVPVLVRPYGDVQKPPSAAIGIASAVFHAATTGDGTELRALQSQHRNIAYVQQANDFLLIFAQTHAEGQALRAESTAQRMLRLVFYALQLMIGPSLTEMESSKLRGAIGRQLTIIDYMCTHITVDVSLAMGTPTFAYGSARGILGSRGHQPSLLYAARMRTGIVDSELCSSSYGKPVDLDLLVICALAQASRLRQKAHSTIYVSMLSSRETTTTLKATVAFEYPASDECVVGLFATDTDELDLKAATLQFPSNDAPDCWPSFWNPLLEDRGLLCCVVLRGELGMPKQSIFSSHPRAFSTSTEDQEATITLPVAWQAMGSFVLSCSEMSPSTSRRTDYMQQDENYTFLHCDHAPLSVFALFAGQVPIETIAVFGRLLASDSFTARY